jgi:hypothetical protein
VTKQTDINITNLTPDNVCCLILVTKNINFFICCARAWLHADESTSVEGESLQEGIVNTLNNQAVALKVWSRARNREVFCCEEKVGFIVRANKGNQILISFLMNQ